MLIAKPKKYFRPAASTKKSVKTSTNNVLRTSINSKITSKTLLQVLDSYNNDTDLPDDNDNLNDRWQEVSNQQFPSLSPEKRLADFETEIRSPETYKEG